MDKAAGNGQTPSYPDAAIAATGAIHGHTVLTRNVRDFRAFDIPFLDPWKALP